MITPTGSHPIPSLRSADKRGIIAMRTKVSRNQLIRRLVNLPACLVGLEAGAGSHHIACQIPSPGHDVRLIPAQYVQERLPRRRGRPRRSATSPRISPELT